MRTLFLAGALLATSVNAQEINNIPPANYRDEIAGIMRSAARDPSSIQDARISTPFLAWMGVARRYVVCVQLNAKNAFGGYTGRTDYIAIYTNGKLLTITEPYLDQCREARYLPFTELN